jgi:hypothetical protein
MTWLETSGMITSLASVGAVLASLRNGRKIARLEVNVNGRLSQLLEVSKAKAFTEGQALGAQEEQERVKNGQ